MEVYVTATAATTASLSFAGVSGGALAIEVQYSNRADFQWSLAPLLRSVSLSVFAFVGLNQAGRYYVRAREILAGDLRGEWSAVDAFSTLTDTLRSLAPQNVMIEPALIMACEQPIAWHPDDEKAGYPVRALGRDDPNSAWWSSPSSGIYGFTAQLSSAPIDTIALLGTCASEASTIRIKASDNLGSIFGAPAYSTAVAPFRASALLPQRRSYHSLVRLPSPQSYKYWRIEIGGSVPGDVFVATYAAFGLARSAKNFAVDSKSELLIESGTLERDRSGNPARVGGWRGRTVEFEIQQMTEAQYEGQFEQLRWLHGATEPVLVVPNSKPGVFLHDRILYGQMQPSRATNNFAPRFSQQFSINSLI